MLFALSKVMRVIGQASPRKWQQCTPCLPLLLSPHPPFPVILGSLPAIKIPLLSMPRSAFRLGSWPSVRIYLVFTYPRAIEVRTLLTRGGGPCRKSCFLRDTSSLRKAMCSGNAIWGPSACVVSQQVWENLVLLFLKVCWSKKTNHGRNGRVVTGFADRRFTDDTDKLQALSGLARMNQSRMQSTYVAGIWRKHIQPAPNSSTAALVWSVQHTGRCYDTYIAPSFPWASLDTSIFFQEQCRGWLCEITGVGTTPVSPLDPFGRVSDGFLTISGPFLRCSLSRGGGVNYLVNLQWELKIDWAYCLLDCPIRRIMLRDGAYSLHRHPQGETQFEETAVHVIFLFQDDLRLTGLVVEQEPSREGYQRVAFVEIGLNKKFKQREVDSFG